jgi:alkylation response protein AidB-like acyl-CoA dehydrogenase
MTIPEEYGGHGLGITEATLLLEEVARWGGAMNAATTIHLSIFGMQPVVVHGSAELKARTLPRIVKGDLHVCFGVTEPGAGVDTSRITTFAKRGGDGYVVNGRKVWISKALESEKILLLTRTTPYDQVTKKTDGMTPFLTDPDRAHVGIRPIPKMGRNTSSNELFIDDLRVPVEDRVGEEGKGFTYIIDGLNPERMLIAAEALGIGRVARRRRIRPRHANARRDGLFRGVQHLPVLPRVAPDEDRAPAVRPDRPRDCRRHIRRGAGQRGPRTAGGLRHGRLGGGVRGVRRKAGAGVHWSMGTIQIGARQCVRPSSSEPCAPRSGSATADCPTSTPPTCPR